MTYLLKRRSRSVLALAVAAGLALAGCGSSSSTTQTSASAASSSSAVSSSTSAPGGYGAPASTATTSGSAHATVVDLAKSTDGPILVDGKGLTLYLWLADKTAKSTCYGACASAWPPLTATGKPSAGTGVAAAKLGTTTRTGGALQVTYNGHPLYYFAGDSSSGQTNGEGSQGFGALWEVVSAAGDGIAAK